MNDSEAIKNYILYLKESENLYITLHSWYNDKPLFSNNLAPFKLHSSPYCIFIKSHSNAYEHCIFSQQKLISKLEREGSFIGTCHAGVKEFVYPFYAKDTLAGFVSVSGYKTDNYTSYIDRISKKYSISKSGLINSYKNLKDTLPPKSKMDALIIPLCKMLELLYLKSSNSTDDMSLFGSVFNFIQVHHCEKITSEDICKRFYCSRSKIAHLIKKKTGKSLPEIINDLRIEDAKELLLHSNIDITEIAFSIGYSDRSYFTNVFKKLVGVSPKEYRKNNKI